MRWTAVGEHIGGIEAEAVEGGDGGGVGLVGDDFEALPAVAREADPLAAGAHEQGDLLGGELGVLDAELDRKVEPIAACRIGRRGGEFHMRAQRRAEEIGEAG